MPEQKRVLSGYDLIAYGLGDDKEKDKDTSKRRASLRSSVMFIERYADLLKNDGTGKLVAVIDDSILSSKSYDYVRDYIREKFIIRAIVSLSGDAFQRAGARSKTSIIYLIHRPPKDESQPDIFMAESLYVGLDDVPPTTPPSKVKQAKIDAEREIGQIIENFKKYLHGEHGDWLVPASRLRLKDKRFNPYFIWGYLRSSEIRARMLSNATGINRHRVAWGNDKDNKKKEAAAKLKDLPVPLAPKKLQDTIAKKYKASFKAYTNSQTKENEGNNVMGESLNVNNEWATNRLRAARPPR